MWTRSARVILRFWRASLVAELEYRFNFVIQALSSVGNLAGGLFGLTLFYQHGYSFDGWTFDESLAVLGTFTALTGFTNVLLTPNLSRIVEHVEKGTLDFILLKPVDSQLWVSLRQLSPWGAPDLLVGLGLIGFSVVQTGASASDAALAFVPLVAAVILLYGLWFLLASSSIWFVKVYNATEVLRGFLDAGRYPIAAYPAAWRLFFTFVVPVAFLTSVPADVALGRARPEWIAGALVLSAAFFGASRWFWRYALRSYTSASS